MTKHVDPPASEKILDELYARILEKSFHNLPVTVIEFPGAGKTAELKYLVSQHSERNFPADRLLTFLDLNMLVENEDRAFTAAMSYIRNTFAVTSDKNNVIDYLHELTFKKNFKLTIVLEKFQRACNQSTKRSELVEILNTLFKINPMHLSYIFMVDSDIQHSVSRDLLGRLAESFMQNMVCGKDVLFDLESGQRLMASQEKWNSLTLTQSFKDKVVPLTLGDPTLLKLIVTRSLGNTAFQENFVEESDIDGLYDLVGSDDLNTRFVKIVKNLSNDSIEYLLGNKSEPTEFLLRTGLVKGVSEGKHSLINDFLQAFVKRNEVLISSLKVVSAAATTERDAVSSLSELLTGQELLAWSVLVQSNGSIVSREALAQAAWGKDWESSYTDWALDQLILRLRKKVSKIYKGKNIKTIRNKGFILA
jgi:sulfur carrier protein ThiS